MTIDISNDELPTPEEPRLTRSWTRGRQTFEVAITCTGAGAWIVHIDDRYRGSFYEAEGRYIVEPSPIPKSGAYFADLASEAIEALD